MMLYGQWVRICKEVGVAYLKVLPNKEADENEETCHSWQPDKYSK
jgi:hypothetical protein